MENALAREARALLPQSEHLPARGGQYRAARRQASCEDHRATTFTHEGATLTKNSIALFIDGANLYATARTIGLDVDYKRLLAEFQGRGSIVRAYCYLATIEDHDAAAIRPLLDWLNYNGYTVVTKVATEFVDASGHRRAKGSMDIELVVDAMELADRIGKMVLFSGNGDLRPLVEAMQRRGVNVTVISTIFTRPAMIADELRRQADIFTDLVELKEKVCRDPAERLRPRTEAANLKIQTIK
jgi:uncharacterized LabA/DUF88 family protein